MMTDIPLKSGGADNSDDFHPFQFPSPPRYMSRAARRHRRNLPISMGGISPLHYEDQAHDSHALCGVKRKGVEYTGVMERVTCTRCRQKLALRGFLGRAGG